MKIISINMGCCCDKSYDSEPLLLDITYHIVFDKNQLEKRRKTLDVSSQLSIEIMHIRSFLQEEFRLEPMPEPSLYLNTPTDYELFDHLKKIKIDLSTMKWKNNHLIIPVLAHEIRVATINCSENDKKRIMYMLII